MGRFCPQDDALRARLAAVQDWPAAEFRAAGLRFREEACSLEAGKAGFPDLRSFLLGRRQFMLGLLENPNLLEHERFTDLLWAVFHLTEELACRADVSSLAAPDRDHLVGDLRRAYALLVVEWLAYMAHLREDYPYLFSLAARTNPFAAKAGPEVSA